MLKHGARRMIRLSLGLIAVAVLSACAVPQTPDEVIDPLEPVNRGTHEFNKGLDRFIFREASEIYVKLVPDPLVQGLSNASGNLSQPSFIINNVLQGRFETAMHNTMRFLVNTTFGIGGIFDPASEMGLEELDTDFGETLFVWGVGEGAFIEVPGLGPHTSRHISGRVVDVVTDPIGELVGLARPFEAQVALFTAEQLKQRAELSSFVDDTLYNSIDSYATTRILYLQNRRFQLGRLKEPTYVDPYEELFGDPGATPDAALPGDDLYFDPYEDPYAQ